jgi:hypothetical protein
MATTVYLLCLLTSAACAWLLVRSYSKSRTKLLLWSAACFVMLALNNLLVVVDLVILPNFDLTIPRSLSALAGVGLLLYGFVSELD